MALLEELQAPIITTTARTPDGEPLTEPYDIEQRLGHVIDGIIDAGIILPNPSTVIDMTGETPAVIREGAGDVSMLQG